MKKSVMLKNKKIVALIPLRGGSKSIPYKNIKLFGGKPLAYWVCRSASESKYIDEVYVSTEDPKIKKTVEGFKLGIKVIDRPPELAQDSSTTESVMLHFMEQAKFDVLTLIQATSPLTTSTDLDAAIELFFEKGYDSLLTGTLYKKFFWTPDAKPLHYDFKHRPLRQQFEGVVHENGAFYLTRRSILEKEKNRLGGSIGMYLFPEEKNIDIDEPNDWKVAERLLLALRKKNVS